MPDKTDEKEPASFSSSKFNDDDEDDDDDEFVDDGALPSEGLMPENLWTVLAAAGVDCSAAPEGSGGREGGGGGGAEKDDLLPKLQSRSLWYQGQFQQSSP